MNFVDIGFDSPIIELSEWSVFETKIELKKTGYLLLDLNNARQDSCSWVLNASRHLDSNLRIVLKFINSHQCDILLY